MQNKTTKPEKTIDQQVFVWGECFLAVWWIALLCGVTFSVVGGIVIFKLIDVQYLAKAKVRVGGMPTLLATSKNDRSEQQYRNTQMELITGTEVLERALNSSEVLALSDLGIQIGEIDEVRSHLEVSAPRNSEIVSISFPNDDAEISFTLTNAIVKSYLSQAAIDNVDLRSKRLGLLRELDEETEKRLAEAWRRLQRLAMDLGASDRATISLQTQAEVENYRSYSAMLREVRTEKRDVLRVLQTIREAPELLAEEMTDDEGTSSVKYAMFTAKLDKDKALLQWGPNHPDVLEAKHREDSLKEFYQKVIADSLTEPQTAEERVMMEPLATLSRLEKEEASLSGLIDEIERRLGTLSGEKATELEMVRNEVERLSDQSDRLWQAKESLQIESKADPRIQLVSLAELPRHQDTSKRDKFLLMACAGGLVFGVGLVTGLEFLRGRIHSYRDLVTRAGTAPLGANITLPRLVRESRALPVSARAAKEKLRQLTAELLTLPPQPKVLTVACAKSEGEAGFLANQIAYAAAEMERKVHLIDLNSEHSENSSVLSEKETEETLVPETTHPNLSQLGNSEISEVKRSLLQGRNIAESVGIELGEQDLIVISAPPVLTDPCCLYLAKHSDLVVLSVRTNHSKVGELQLAQNTLHSAGVGSKTIIVK